MKLDFATTSTNWIKPTIVQLEITLTEDDGCASKLLGLDDGTVPLSGSGTCGS